ncbi:MAG: DUF1080 domain-containing protein [Planctomycetes bacterium]|nr:DUF1080 domain-containing protein [Planctomycetota bacterium]
MLRAFSLLFILTCCVSIASAQTVTKPIKLFNGKDLKNFYTWLNAPKKGEKPYGKNNDPEKVFTVVNGAIRVSGKVFGCFTTEKEYANYRLIVEFKWGTKTWPPRENATMDSGVLLHCVGPDGGAGGNWMESIECQLIEGGTGDFIMVRGKTQPKITVPVKKIGNQWYYDAKGELREFPPGRANWYGRDPNWKDVKGFRGKNDVEKPVGEWNTLECVCDGDKITNILNGKVVNAGIKATHTKGKILFQSEGAEILFRRIDLMPLKTEVAKKQPKEEKKKPKTEPKKTVKVGQEPEPPPVFDYSQTAPDRTKTRVEPVEPMQRPRLFGGRRPLERLFNLFRRR